MESIFGALTNGAVSGPGVLASYTYDALGRRSAIDLAATSGNAARAFAHSPAGQITTRGLSNHLDALSRARD